MRGSSEGVFVRPGEALGETILRRGVLGDWRPGLAAPEWMQEQEVCSRIYSGVTQATYYISRFFFKTAMVKCFKKSGLAEPEQKQKKNF